MLIISLVVLTWTSFGRFSKLWTVRFLVFRTPLMDSKEYRAYPRNTLTVPRISARHTAQLRNAGEQVSQQTRCPQGRNTVLTSLSMHTLHVLASRRRLFSSNSAKHSKTTNDKHTNVHVYLLRMTHHARSRFHILLLVAVENWQLEGSGVASMEQMEQWLPPVSYTHLTLPTNREV